MYLSLGWKGFYVNLLMFTNKNNFLFYIYFSYYTTYKSHIIKFFNIIINY